MRPGKRVDTLFLRIIYKTRVVRECVSRDLGRRYYSYGVHDSGFDGARIVLSAGRRLRVDSRVRATSRPAHSSAGDRQGTLAPARAELLLLFTTFLRNGPSRSRSSI